MAITDELREYTKKQIKWLDVTKVHYRELLAIADRIDREHRMAMEKVAAEADALPMTDENMAEHGWIRLPLDADGVAIHVGDLLTDTERQSIGLKPTTVKCILYNDEGCAVSANDPHGYWYDPSLLRHHHAPTVEDVLREFADEVQRCCDTADTIAEYAAKLRLAEEVDE